MFDKANARLQECLPCRKGSECTSPSCTVCTECKPGYYKASISTEACLACPMNTYGAMAGATKLDDCLSCPLGAHTNGKVGETALQDCSCDSRLYSSQLQPFTCSACPAGALCADSTCALAKPGLKCSPLASAVVGIWRRGPDGLFTLLGCPTGFRLINDTGHDVQACIQCPDGKYMLDSNDPTLSCQTCPLSAKVLSCTLQLWQQCIGHKCFALACEDFHGSLYASALRLWTIFPFECVSSES